MTYVKTTYTVTCPSCNTEGAYFGKRSIIRDFDRADRTYRWTCCGARAPWPGSKLTDTYESI